MAAYKPLDIATAEPIERRVRIDELMQLTGMSRTTVWRRVKSKNLHAPAKDGGITFWNHSWVAEYMNDPSSTKAA
jgi:predicted DNA-binding transcriptional regulator AlpA